jgi:uncharacterized membrane protein
MQSRFKSKVTWVAIAALLLFILKNYGLLTPIGLTPDSYNELVTLIFTVLTAFGIFNNPTNKEEF